MRGSFIALCAGLLLLAGGATHTRNTQDVRLSADATWLVLPLVNRTTTPQAGLAAQAIVEAVIAEHGVTHRQAYQADDDEGVLFEASSRASREAMRQWAAGRGDYVITGVVHEWRYKTGVDGEPAVGVMIEIRDATGNVVYSGPGARAGGARQSLSETGQRVIDDLLAPVID